ncbi:adenosine kinase [Nematocida sp. AWRm80]|nr:adenosine kinase [Nematocida sp. AWRm80]
MPVVFTVCVPFIDIYIQEPELVRELGISPNAMTLYDCLDKRQKLLLSSYLDNKNIITKYGGMTYNTCMEIATNCPGVLSMFIGPFSTDALSKRVFNAAIQGEVPGLKILSTPMESEPGVCFVIPNGKNRAMITKINPKQQVNQKMIKDLLSQVSKREKHSKESLIYLSGYTVESSPETQKIIETIKTNEIRTPIAFNLADPGVIKRSFKEIKPFLKHSEWTIGNIAEFTELFIQIKGREPKSPEELYQTVSETTKNSLITAGSHLIVALCKTETETKRFTIKPTAIKVENTTGAGDILAANFLAGVLKKDPIEKVLKDSVTRTTEYLLGLTTDK